MKCRNRHLERERQQAKALPIDAGIAACLLDAMTTKESARALGVCLDWVEKREQSMRKRYGARNRVALAMALQREAMGWQ